MNVSHDFFIHSVCRNFMQCNFHLFFVKNIDSVQFLKTVSPENKKGESGARERKTRSDIEKETAKEHDEASSKEKEKMMVKN